MRVHFLRDWILASILTSTIAAGLLSAYVAESEASIWVQHALLWLSAPCSLIVVGVHEVIVATTGLKLYANSFQASNSFGTFLWCFIYLLCFSFQAYWVVRLWHYAKSK